MGHKYRCAHCDGEFVADWSDEEARQESQEIFAMTVTPETHAEVCDDCFQQFMAWYRKAS